MDFFFVISGFIILFVHYNDVADSIRLSGYVQHRVTRLMPAYFVTLTFTILLESAGHRGLPSAADIFWSASLLPSKREIILSVAWTLRYEVVFYTLFCCLILNRAIGVAVLGAWGVLTVSCTLMSLIIADLPLQFYGAWNIEFFLGMGVAYVLQRVLTKGR